ncbi:hypothetical protein F2Q69_00062759 [Brassica cretica]|uniref:Uncharacterized protein n=1 Tax=Brassica cretica TaxID=69181 RepID=A0A8S9RB26_BRACR|nr:hypothetical protein F2Q69_00062759 [Brassica cretica]
MIRIMFVPYDLLFMIGTSCNDRFTCLYSLSAPEVLFLHSWRSRSFIPSSWSPASNLSIAYRTLKSEVEELKELDQEREKYYELKCSEMNEFMQNVERFRSDNLLKVQNLRDQVKEV